MAKNEYLANAEENCNVAFQIAPLVARYFGAKLCLCYFLDASHFSCALQVDMVVIDGPAHVLGGREGTLSQALEYARPGTVFILDDAYRDGEKRAVKHWSENLGDAIEIVPLEGFTKGMIGVIVRDMVAPNDLTRHRIELTRKELAKLCPPGESVIVAGDPWWSEMIFDNTANILPFPQREGQYWGPPSSNESAIDELERLKLAGGSKLVIGGPFHWWLTYYSGFAKYIFERFHCLLKNDRTIVIDLLTDSSVAGASGPIISLPS